MRASETAAWIRQRITTEGGHASANGAVLQLFDDLWTGYYLHPDGTLLSAESPSIPLSLAVVVDPFQRLVVLRAAVEQDQQLASLLPERPAGQDDCPACGASGRAPATSLGGGPATIPCVSCRGTGWLSTTTDGPIAV